MRAFCKSLAARAVVLSCFLVLAAAAEDTTAPAETDEQPSPIEPAGKTNEAGAVLQLSIGIGPNDPFPFGNANGEVLFKGGAATASFSCGVLHIGQPAIEPSNVAVRRFSIWQAREGSILNSFGLGGDSDLSAGASVTDGRLRVFGENGMQEDSSVLLARLESPLPNGTKIQAGEENDPEKEELAVQYDCRREGKAVVELRLLAEGSDGSRRSICLRWVKQCSVGWNSLKIEEGDSLVFANGQIQDEWKKRMDDEGTHQPVSKFLISAQGIELVRTPAVSSNQQLLSAELIGPLTNSERNEVSTEPITLSVLYNCRFDGFADVTLVLQKVTMSSEEPEELVIKYRKTCGVTTFRHLDVHVKSEKLKNKTQAVIHGAALPGFARPCRVGELVLNPALRKHQELGELCDHEPPVLVLLEKEMRTVLELDTDVEAGEVPIFSPAPDVTYDHKVLRVAVVQAPIVSHTSSRAKGTQHRVKKRQTLTLKYTCYKDAESVVMVTLHVLGHKSIHLAWRKKCAEPRAKVGKALTAPQAIMVTMFICGIIVTVVCLIFAFSGSRSSSRDAEVRKTAYSRAAASDDGDDIELPARVGKPQEEEVVYHS